MDERRTTNGERAANDVRRFQAKAEKSSESSEDDRGPGLFV